MMPRATLAARLAEWRESLRHAERVAADPSRTPAEREGAALFAADAREAIADAAEALA
jgi:hypothetical protein